MRVVCSPPSAAEHHGGGRGLWLHHLQQAAAGEPLPSAPGEVLSALHGHRGLGASPVCPCAPGQDAELLPLLGDPVHKPFTLLWPSDAAFSALPENRQKFLYRRERRDVLASLLKAHMIRDTKVNVSARRLVAPKATRGATASLWLCQSGLAKYFAAIEHAAFQLS